MIHVLVGHTDTIVSSVGFEFGGVRWLSGRLAFMSKADKKKVFQTLLAMLDMMTARGIEVRGRELVEELLK